MEVDHVKSNPKKSTSQIWVICHFFPFVRVGQYTFSSFLENRLELRQVHTARETIYVKIYRGLML